MKKPSVYFDTSVISAYWYEGGDVAMLARRLHTREWWDAERKHLMVRRLRYLTSTADVKALSKELIRRGLVPSSKPGDAEHLAISASHGIDYLLTWNYAHMANASVQDRLTSLCKDMGLVAPLMVSPESIPQDRFGQSIRRKPDG